MDVRRLGWQAEEMGVSVRDAATRVFSNAAGSYSANVGLTIENGGWDGEEQLQEQFVSRKGFAFNADKPGMMEQQTELFRNSLKRVDVTFQNLDSSEISLTDVSHYFDSDPTKVRVRERRRGSSGGCCWVRGGEGQSGAAESLLGE